jgi:phage baseplate assembly protein V
MKEGYKSAQIKRGIVKENDPKTGRSRVEFVDEDESVSHWLAWNMPAAGGTKIFHAPDIGSQVNCALDRHGEDGLILGARYSTEDTPPTQNDKLIKMLLEGGADFGYDKASGTLIFKLTSIRIEANLTVIGDIDTTGTLTNNGKNVGSTHTHVSAPSGPPGPPN